jgi:hypothetical protein
MSPAFGCTEGAKLGYLTDALSSFPVYTTISGYHMRSPYMQNLDQFL